MRPRTYVLEEDQHLENLRKIIKRDFFGDATDQAIPLSLDNYLANFKSNENKVFSELVEADKSKFKKQHWWLEHKDKLLMLQNQSKPYHNMLKKDQTINGIDLSIVQQKPDNQIFFYSQDKTQSRLSSQHHKEKKIITDNCYVNNEQSVRVRQYIANQEGNKYESVEQPQPSPEAIPLMTWGQIESTPVRLQNNEYRIPQTPARDLLLEKLNKKIEKQKGQKNRRKSQMLIKLQSSMRSGKSSQRIQQRKQPKQQKKEGKKEKNLLGLLNIGKQS